MDDKGCPPTPPPPMPLEDDADFPKSDVDGEEFSEADVEATKRELGFEISALEWEFRHLKEALHAERVLQVDTKLQKLRSGEAPELLKVFAVIDESFRIRKQVTMHRRDMELEVANKEFDNAQQTATYDAEENLRSTEERIRLRIQEAICALQVERAQARTRLFGGGGQRGGQESNEDRPSVVPLLSAASAALLVPGLEEQLKQEEEEAAEDFRYLPGQDLEPRRKPVPLSPSCPRLVYELDEEDIQSDIDAIKDAVKNQKVSAAIAYLKSQRREL